MKTQILIIILSFSVSLFAQNKTGIGNVSDNTGILIPNAVVQISPASNPTDIYEYVCDKNGNYVFNITSNDTLFVLNILPSEQTMQFSHSEETIKLSSGDNGILFHNVNLSDNNGINFTVTDTAGNPVTDAKVMLYNTQKKWGIDSCRIAKPFYTDANGQVEINALLPIKYWFNVKKGNMTNRFTSDTTSGAIDTTNITNINVVIRDLTQNEFYMCGLCDNKTWVTDSMIIFGITFPYDADTKLLSDASWWDSNGRYGFWWFNSDETVMTYNYLDGTADGSIIDATNLTITDSTWVGDIDMSGITTTYFMSVPYLDTINLSLSVQDTTIYLNSNGVANITFDDLFINSSRCFTCSKTLSQSHFDMNDLGENMVYTTIEDRCGNYAVDTFTISVKASISNITDNTAKSIINVYPNPANNFIVIESQNEIIKEIDIYTVAGKLERKTLVNKRQCTINVSGFLQGIYFLKIYSSKGVVTKRIIVE